MKNGESVERNGVVYEWLEYLPCHACCFYSRQKEECEVPDDLPFCAEGGWYFAGWKKK